MVWSLIDPLAKPDERSIPTRSKPAMIELQRPKEFSQSIPHEKGTTTIARFTIARLTIATNIEPSPASLPASTPHTPITPVPQFPQSIACLSDSMQSLDGHSEH